MHIDSLPPSSPVMAVIYSRAGPGVGREEREGQGPVGNSRALSPGGGNGKLGPHCLVHVTLGFNCLELGYREHGFPGPPLGCGLPKVQPISGSP